MNNSKQSKKISILICSKGRRFDIERLASDLIKMNTKYQKEIIVVEETGKPSNIEGVTYISHPLLNKGIAVARNMALQYADSDIIVFLDDDCEVSEGWLDKLLKPFDDQSIVGVQGGVCVTLPSNAIGWAESILGFPGGGIKRVVEANNTNLETMEISTLNCSYRRKFIDLVGGFDENLKYGGEDYILAKQVSLYGKCFFVPSATVRHKPRGNLEKIWSWFVGRGKAEVDVIKLKKYKKANYRSMIRRSLAIKLAILCLIGMFFLDYIAYIFGIFICLYGVMIYVRYYKVWKASSAMILSFAILPVVKSTMDIATDWGRLKALINR